MKRVLIEVPDSADTPEIFYWNGFQYVRANVIRSAHFSTRAISYSDSDMEELRKRIKEFTPEAVLPRDTMSPPSREEFEALRSRVEKLEQESKRQCARVIKMEEGISDDLK